MPSLAGSPAAISTQCCSSWTLLPRPHFSQGTGRGQGAQGRGHLGTGPDTASRGLRGGWAGHGAHSKAPSPGQALPGACREAGERQCAGPDPAGSSAPPGAAGKGAAWGWAWLRTHSLCSAGQIPAWQDGAKAPLRSSATRPTVLSPSCTGQWLYGPGAVQGEHQCLPRGLARAPTPDVSGEHMGCLGSAACWLPSSAPPCPGAACRHNLHPVHPIPWGPRPHQPHI